MKYSDYPYERISVEEQNELLNERLKRFNHAASADEQIAVIKEVDQNPQGKHFLLRHGQLELQAGPPRREGQGGEGIL